jgi:predicted nucleotidyltransferase
VVNNLVGFRQSDLLILISVLQKHSEVKEAWLFGSRAKGNFKKGSDVDIALKGNNLNFNIIADISYELNEETSLPYKFDVLNYDTINNNDLKQHIDRVGICFYPESGINS